MNETESPTGVPVERMVSVPVEVWWGLKWVKAEARQKDDKTIYVRLKTRTGETTMCCIRNTRGHINWRNANAESSATGGAEGSK